MNKYWSRQDPLPRRHIFPKVNERGIVECDETTLLLSHDLWSQYGSVVGAAAQDVNRKLTSQVCSSASAERDWRLYKGIVSKKRITLSHARMRGWGPHGPSEPPPHLTDLLTNQITRYRTLVPNLDASCHDDHISFRVYLIIFGFCSYKAAPS